MSSSSSSSTAPRRSVRLRKLAQQRFVTNAVDGFRFVVEAHSAYGMPNEIFLYLRRPYNPTTGEEADEFSNVCSVPDLEEYPVGAPTGLPAFFRDSKIDLVFRSMHEADEAWAVIQHDVQVLVDTLNLNDELAEEIDIEIGG